MTRSLALLLALAALSACVAPEEPDPRPAGASAAIRPSVAPGAALEDAPVPNRAVRNTNSPVIRIQQ